MADQKTGEVLKTIARDRTRTNILKTYEQRALAWLVQRIPGWMSSNMLTAIGFSGNILVMAGFLLASALRYEYLLLGVPGFLISWFGDSLDGRVAYFRNKPRKWFGFTLDLTTDWIGTFLIGLGFAVYVEGITKYLGFLFVVLYGWEIITALLRYKITGKYAIDAGKLGPTEVRLILTLVLVAEVLFRGSLAYLGVLACLVLFVVNLIDFRKLLKQANERDQSDKRGETPAS